MEVQVRAVSFVRKNEHIPVMRELDYRAYIRADAVVGGVVDEDRHRVGIVVHRFFDEARLHSERDTDVVIDVGIDVNGLGSADEDAPIAVPTSLEDRLVPAVTCPLAFTVTFV